MHSAASRAAFLALIISCTAVDATPPALDGRRWMEGVEVIAKSLETTGRRMASLVSTSEWRFEEKLSGLPAAVWQPGRRLTESQCSWNNGTSCRANMAFLSTLIPSTGPLREMYDAQALCEVALTKEDCEAKSVKCGWETDQVESRCTGVLDHLIDSMMAGLLDPTGCGWIGAIMSSAQCGLYDASDPRCSAASDCTIGTAYEATGSNCTSVQVCKEKDYMERLCPNLNMTEKMAECVLQANPPFTAESLSNKTAVLLGVAPCMFTECPQLQQMMMATVGTLSTCMALENMTDCYANSLCKWNEDGMCEVDDAVATREAMPDTCAYKNIMESMSECQGKQQNQCVSSTKCQWQQVQECHEEALTERSDCEPTGSEIMQALIRAGSSEALGMMNAGLVEKHCIVQMDEDSCVNASVPLESLTTQSPTNSTNSTDQDVTSLAAPAMRLTSAASILSVVVLAAP